MTTNDLLSSLFEYKLGSKVDNLYIGLIIDSINEISSLVRCILHRATHLFHVCFYSNQYRLMKYLLFISFVAFFKQFGIFLNFSRYRGNDLATCFLQMRYNTFCKVKPIAKVVLSTEKDETFSNFFSESCSYGKSFVRPLHGDWCVFCLLIHCIIGSYFVYLSSKNSIIFLPWHTNPRIPMSM